VLDAALQDKSAVRRGEDDTRAQKLAAHFFGQVPTGATVLKRRQLRAAGWALLPVPYWEWNALGKSPDAKEAYLLTALKELAEALPQLEECQSDSDSPTKG
jgi:hypothetical protein